MLTAEQIASLKLGINPIDDTALLQVNAALDWITQNTTIDTTDIDKLPACARLFMAKFVEINGLRAGVTSESIEGLSQSFGEANKSTLIWDTAKDLLNGYLKSRVRFVPAKRRWNEC